MVTESLKFWLVVASDEFKFVAESVTLWLGVVPSEKIWLVTDSSAFLSVAASVDFKLVSAGVAIAMFFLSDLDSGSHSLEK